ncbi:MAG: methylated-DNA--[protein]-cysteine S-methyltransferase [Nitrospina sp.]|nr:methylated-DNA--[protein]-cysteine S-methyltransferase [Nitrospina sp.]MBT6295930.1 methylated-DNA--[protein]-cysteine S-methyltransferase [Nitrospina sp.]
MSIIKEQSELSNKLIYTTFNTPLGKMGVAVTPYGICRVALTIIKESEFIESLRKIYHSPQKQPRKLLNIEKEFNLYFSGKLKKFSFKVDIRQGTRFQQLVWNKLAIIPFGKTRSYQWLALAISQPKACRAVGNANGKNPTPIIIPCHRVIQKNGELGGFTGGTHLKKYLLNLEKKSYANLS